MQPNIQFTLMPVLVVVVVALWSRSARSECNVCSATTSFACVQKDAARFCENSMPTGSIVKCGENQLCDYDGLCRNTDEVAVVSCNQCGLCDSNRVFACTSDTTFALCLGGENKSDITGTCSEGYVCNLGSSNICTKKGTGATCPINGALTDPPPTPSPRTNPNEFCAHVAEESRFPTGIALETTCHEFVRCFNTSRGWVGGLYLCPGSAYFHDNRIGCTLEAPQRCNPAVASLNYHF